MSRIDIVPAANMKAGDLFAGYISQDAPTTPVQTWAAAHKIASVTPYTDEGTGRRMLHLTSAAGFDLTPVPAAWQCLVIRPGT